MNDAKTLVTFRTQGKVLRVDGIGVPFVAGRDLKLHRVSENEYEVVHRNLDSSVDSADYLVGDIPVLFVSLRSESLKLLHLPPPPPFTRALLSQMQERVLEKLGTVYGHEALGYQESSVGLTKAHGQDVHVKFLDQVVKLGVPFLGGWPRRPADDLKWKRSEVGGGREDFRETVRNPHISRFSIGLNGLTLPERTARRAAGAEPWTSSLLSFAAAELSQRVAHHYSNVNSRSIPLTSVLNAIAQRAMPDSREPSPPIPTWPSVALHLYIAIRQATAVFDRDSYGESEYAPTVLLWRLYEHWIGAELLPSMAESPDLVIARGYGFDWHATWTESGLKCSLLAQPHIGAARRTFGGALFSPIKSITSSLVPDYLLQTYDGSAIETIAIDCKRRRPDGLDARDIAEAGSKYVWGLIVGDGAGRRLDRVSILTSSIRPPEMNDRESLIKATRALPSDEASTWRLGLMRG